MVISLKKAGWTGADIQQHVKDLKTHGIEELDRFAGGELRPLKGRAIYPVLLEMTALRLAMHRTRAGSLRVAPTECPHGYRMSACNTCTRR